MTATPLHHTVNPVAGNTLLPRLSGDWWTIAGNPDLGRYNREGQQPLDFSIWRATDGSWQMAACCRRTGCGGKGRLFHRWESRSLLSEDWEPKGILMEADPSVGETPGGLQAPSVVEHDGEFLMFYGNWVHICMARSTDGKTFARQIGPDGRSGLFPVDDGSSTRDPHVLRHGGRYYLYYTGVTANRGAIYCRVSDDLSSWGDQVIVNQGGSGGSGPSDAECPFVLFLPRQQAFYLFRTHTINGGERYATSVYRSDDPMNFGSDTDELKICDLSLEAVRIVEDRDRTYVAALKPDLSGMMMARMTWAPAV